MANEMNITQHLLILTDAEYDQLVIALRENFYINKKLEQAFDRYFGRKMNDVIDPPLRDTNTYFENGKKYTAKNENVK